MDHQQQHIPEIKYEKSRKIEQVELIEMTETNSFKEIATIPLSVLTNLLTCSICRDLMDNTHVGITCMHRFCGPCIEKYITCTQSADRSCPFCRCRIASRRQFKPEKFCTDMIENVLTYAQTSSKKRFQITEYQDLHRTRKAKIFEESKDAAKRIVIPEYTTPKKAAPIPIEPEIVNEDDMVNLGLRFYVSSFSLDETIIFLQMMGPNSLNQTQALTRPYISAPPECTILDLKKFLLSQLPDATLLSLNVINIWFKQGNKMSRLAESMTLQKVCIELWDRQSDFILDYSLTSPFTVPQNAEESEIR